MSAPIYDTIGHNYRARRAADPRIAAALIELMDAPAGGTIGDVGAGAVLVSGFYFATAARAVLAHRSPRPAALPCRAR